MTLYFNQLSRTQDYVYISAHKLKLWQNLTWSWQAISGYEIYERYESGAIFCWNLTCRIRNKRHPNRAIDGDTSPSIGLFHFATHLSKKLQIGRTVTLVNAKKFFSKNFVSLCPIYIPHSVFSVRYIYIYIIYINPESFALNTDWKQIDFANELGILVELILIPNAVKSNKMLYCYTQIYTLQKNRQNAISFVDLWYNSRWNGFKPLLPLDTLRRVRGNT